MPKKIKIGDIVEIPTKKGLAYAQFSHFHEPPPRFGALLRVLPGFYKERPSDFGAIVAQKETFSVFFPLQAAVSRKILEIVFNCDVPSHAKKFPLFRAGATDPKTGKVMQWWLWDGVREWKIDKLTDEQMDLPIRLIVNDLSLISKIEQGWTPRNSEAFIQAGRLRKKVREIPAITGIRHFLLFKNMALAKQAGEVAATEGFQFEVLDNGSGFSLIVRQQPPLTEEYVENATARLREIAGKFNGTYDAWETMLGDKKNEPTRQP